MSLPLILPGHCYGIVADAIGVGASDRIAVGPGAIIVHALSPDRRRGGARALMAGYARFGVAAARRVTRLHLRHGQIGRAHV